MLDIESIMESIIESIMDAYEVEDPWTFEDEVKGEIYGND